MKKTSKSLPSLPVPTESEEQQLVFEWAQVARIGYPELELLFHIPNEGKRAPKTGARLKREGLKKRGSRYLFACKGGKVQCVIH